MYNRPNRDPTIGKEMSEFDVEYQILDKFYEIDFIVV